MRYRFVTLDVFTQRRFGGNPLAVFPEATGLSTQQMSQIAREFNLSETAFVLPPEDPRHSHRVRIFTPSAELLFAGHPTVGTAFALAQLGLILPQGNPTTLVLEEGIGSVPVTLHWGSRGVETAYLSAAQLPELGPQPPPPAIVADMLGIPEEAIETGSWRPQSFSCGLPFLCIAVKEQQILQQLRLDVSLWQRQLASFWAPQVYVLWRDPAVVEPDRFRIAARMFAPGLGIVEDPATGAAAAALAGFLTSATGQISYTCQIEQGYEMGRPSQLELVTEGSQGNLSVIRVGGSAVMVSEGWMQVTDPEEIGPENL
ncbi:MAG: PhzF family phenazine biosynthesis protein [Synechococcaceae cyanobacterium SM2_3_2]|nr:PhzF family phenazine biosynthesis protein [Synechococcaceae cyanobacterium SM2_3_2]